MIKVKTKTKSKKTLSSHSAAYAVILAGGSGTRLWPLSRQLRPKQLCRLGTAKKTLLELTIARLEGLVPPSKRILVTHRDQVAATRKIVGKTVGLVIAEPEARNTANALALAALAIKAQSPSTPTPNEPMMISLHADAWIEDEAAFRKSLQEALEVAKQGLLTLIGVTPKYAETGFGYIERGAALPTPTNSAKKQGFKVSSFREKPEQETAQKYVDSGNFLWNSGIFVFPVGVFLEELRLRLPVSVDALETLFKKYKSYPKIPSSTLARVYKKLPKIAVDHAVLEVSANTAVVETDCGWQDIGSWDALSQVFAPDKSGNLIHGKVICVNTTGSVVQSDGPLLTTLGLTDMVVVHAQGAILVCPRSRAQDVKLIVEKLKAEGLKAFT